ncbi:hypothetical protein B0H11DRAFT_2257614 [Mycena galericulata]|nr:hypothetical protein B0H11DRAFT_2257614 [Mycena galericulata]
MLDYMERIDKTSHDTMRDLVRTFSDQPVGRTILGPKAGDLDAYIMTNYTADRMVLVDVGGVDHTELVKLAEKHFSSLPVLPHPSPSAPPPAPRPLSSAPRSACAMTSSVLLTSPSLSRASAGPRLTTSQ